MLIIQALIAHGLLILIVDSPRIKLAGEDIKPLSFKKVLDYYYVNFYWKMKLTKFFLNLSNQHHLLIIVC